MTDAPVSSSSSSSTNNSQRNVSIVMSILIFTLIVDNLLYAFLFGGAQAKVLTSSFGISLFIIVVAVSYASALYLLSRFVSPIHRQIKTHSSRFNWIYKTLLISQYASAGIIAFMILQLILTSHYYVGLLIATIAISFTLAAIILGLLSYRFLSWYKSSNKNITVLLYGITFAVTAIGIGVIVAVNGSVILLENPSQIGGLQSVLKVYSSSSSDTTQSPKALILYQITYTPSRLGFVLYWIATALLLREYSRKLGRLKFWTLISLPLVSFLAASIFVSPDYQHSLLYDALLVLSALTAGGVLFGITFLIMARSMRRITTTSSTNTATHHNTLAYYLTISAFGTVLITVSLTSPVIYAPFPPFAAAAWSFLGLSSYLYSLGFYFSAISIAQDAKLRQSIRDIAAKESKLLGSIGTAHMEQEIQKKVLKLAKEQEKTLEEQTGVELHEWQQQQVEQENIQDYMAEVFAEVEKSRKKLEK
ncbi:MAG: hypothetical protein FIO02_10645 [Nitrosopumilales archaeon]|nr:hypothetical protein [Nitrosopumilales archaeon]